MFIIKCFHPTLRITKSCCRAVPDDRFEVQNNLTCNNIGFSISAFSREDRLWRNGTTKFSCTHLAVDISRCRASCCAEQPPVTKEGSVPRSRARKEGLCKGRKQESTFESGAWTYISCNRWSTNFVFRRIIYRQEQRADTWPGESKFVFLFSAAVTKTGGWSRWTACLIWTYVKTCDRNMFSYIFALCFRMLSSWYVIKSQYMFFTHFSKICQV